MVLSEALLLTLGKILYYMWVGKDDQLKIYSMIGYSNRDVKIV